ncbi:MAG: TrkA family potassium uptake protein, partial [Anaerolineaceae bacterium]|nr:TrkA family potassium uptake protein [Anaerolineaceae bacterium]
AGGGRTGAQLARFLLKQNHNVKIIDNRRDVLARIHRDLPTEVVVEGSPVDLAVLNQAGIQDADILTACTTTDEMNLVICYLAHKEYNVRRTIARVNNPRNAWLFDKTFSVDVVVNQSAIMAKLIEEEMSMGDMMTLLKLRRGHYSLVEEKIQDDSRGIGVAIKDLNLDHVVIAAIIRQGEVIVPRGITTFESGDEVLAVTNAEGAQRLAEILARPGQKVNYADPGDES